jgi:hypothetical protein
LIDYFFFNKVTIKFKIEFRLKVKIKKNYIKETMDEKIYNSTGLKKNESEDHNINFSEIRPIIDMDRVMKAMRKKLFNQTTILGYGLSSEQTEHNKNVINDLSKIILNSSPIHQISPIDSDLCLNLYISNMKIRTSTKFFTDVLFKNPFDVSLIYNEGKILEVSEEIKNALIRNYWMPILFYTCNC